VCDDKKIPEKLSINHVLKRPTMGGSPTRPELLRWTWYVIERTHGTILAHHNDRRTDAACQALLKKLEIFPIQTFYTDNWQSYSKFIDAEKHVIGKEHTQKIERTNLTFRTHIKRLHRKTICFSKDEALHDKVIGLYIEHEFYQKMDYAQIA